MKQVDVVNSALLSSQIGPAGTIRRIIKYRPYFLERGYDINIFTPDRYLQIKKPSSVPAKDARRGIKGSLLSLVKYWLPKSFVLSAIYMYRKVNKSKPLLSYYRKQKRNPEVVVFHGFPECYFFLKTRKNQNIKTVMFLHSDGVPFKMDLMYYPKLKGTFMEQWLDNIHRYTVENVDKCVFIAKIGMDNFLAAHPDFPQKKCFLLVNGIDDLSTDEKLEVEKLRLDRDTSVKYNMVCCGTLLHRKGQDIVLKALHKLPSEKLSEFHVTFLGKGPLQQELEEMIRQYGLSNNVTLAGGIPNTEVYKYLAKSNIYILMSLNEGLPISIIEAMRCGLPVITADNSGMPEIVKTGYNGVLVETGNIDMLADVFMKMDAYDWEKFGENSRTRFLNEFTFDRMRKEYCDMLDSIFVTK